MEDIVNNPWIKDKDLEEIKIELDRQEKYEKYKID